VRSEALRLEIFPGGHAHHWEQLEAFNDLTSAWLDERPQSLERVAEAASLAGMRGRFRNDAYRLPDLCLARCLAAVPGKIDHISECWPSGVSGLEPEVIMLGEFANS